MSENAELAERCRENGIIFIGPSPEVIRLMSDKVAAKEIAERSGVPMLGASKGAVRDVDDARETADRLRVSGYYKGCFWRRRKGDAYCTQEE